MGTVFNNNPGAFIDMNTLFPVLNDKVGLTSDQWKKAMENANYLYNHLGLADVEVGSVSTVFNEPGKLADVVVTHREEKIGDKSTDYFDFTFYVPTPEIRATATATLVNRVDDVGITLTQTPIYTSINNEQVITGYNFEFDAKLLGDDEAKVDVLSDGGRTRISNTDDMLLMTHRKEFDDPSSSHKGAITSSIELRDNTVAIRALPWFFEGDEPTSVQSGGAEVFISDIDGKYGVELSAGFGYGKKLNVKEDNVYITTFKDAFTDGFSEREDEVATALTAGSQVDASIENSALTIELKNAYGDVLGSSTVPLSGSSEGKLESETMSILALADSWVAEDNDPFAYKATIQTTIQGVEGVSSSQISSDAIYELINNNPINFAKYGFALNDVYRELDENGNETFMFEFLAVEKPTQQMSFQIVITGTQVDIGGAV